MSLVAFHVLSLKMRANSRYVLSIGWVLGKNAA